MTDTATYEVKPPSAVLAEDVICQSFIQSSSTLAYACLLIRRGRHDLAAHVLQILEAKPASRFKDMVFYLQIQIGIETGDFAAVKRRLVPRVHQHPNDMVALSLLASCVHLEWEDWLRRNPELAAGNLPGPAGVADVADIAEAAIPEAGPPEYPGYRTLAVPTVPSSRFESTLPSEVRAVIEAAPDHRLAGEVPEPGEAPEDGLSSLAGAGAPFVSLPSASNADFGLYQGLAADPNAQALSLWNSGQRTQRSMCRKPALESLVSALPHILPSGLADAVRDLEGGKIHKACFSFQVLTVTTMHGGNQNLGLVTGNMNQGLLTMVRAENIFLKGAGAAAARVGAA